MLQLHSAKARIFLSLGALLLTAAVLCPTVLPTAGETAPTATTEAPLDFSNPLAEVAKEIDVQGLLSLLLGDGAQIPTVEAEYLATLSEHPLKYNPAVPAQYAEVDHSDNTLTVTASPYTYTSASGVQVTWYPAAEGYVGDRLLSLSSISPDGTRIGYLEDVEDASGLRLTVPYTCTLTVPATEADHYLNLAYRYAETLCREQADYESRLAAYNAYLAYLQEKAAYDTAYAKWQEYTTKKAKYDRDLAKYQAYEQELAAYRANVAAFEAYKTAKAEYEQKKNAYDAAREAYATTLATYEAALSSYERNQAELARAAATMTVLESAFISADGKQLYATLMGDTVATVVNKKDELVNVGKCNPADIDCADAATKALQSLLTAYRGLKSVPEKFAFYSAHYTEIKQNFINLYGSLRSLYNNSNVKTTLINRDRLERYMEFVSQLYVISTGLDDDTNRSADWTIAGRYDPAWFDYRYYSYEDLLVDPAHRPDDCNNADPTGVSCPSEMLTPPTPPAPFTLTAPVEPEEVCEPVEPEAVARPTEPEVVNKPTRPTAVENPGDEPIAPAFSALQRRLMAACSDGTLAPRRTNGDLAISLSATLQCNLQAGHVEFYDADGQTLLFSANPIVGDAIEYGGATPTRADTPKYTYTFVGWKDEEGRLLEDLGVSENAPKRFYASYTETVRQYTVTWSVEGVETSVSLPYGSSPVFDGTPEKPTTAQYIYRFAGWLARGETDHSNHLADVTTDVTYEAVFEPILRRYTVTWICTEDQSISTEWDYGATPVFNSTPERPADDRYVYIFGGWDTTPTAVTGDVTYTAQYTALPILPPTDPSQMPASVVLQEETYLATVPVGGQQIDRLLALAQTNDRTVTLRSEGQDLDLYLNEAAVSELLAAGITHVCLSAESEGEGYVIRLLNAEGADVPSAVPLTLRYTGATVYTKAYVKEESTLTPVAYTYDNGTLTLRVRERATLVFRDEYTVTLTPAENGSVSLPAGVSCATAGDTVTLLISPDGGYQAENVSVIGTVSGTVYPVNPDGTFVMPDEPVTVSVTFSRKTFTVVFMADGEIISSQTYFSGETLVLPDDPQKATEGNKIYTFIGWSPVVISTVTADATYVAQFRESIQGNASEYIPPDSKDLAYILWIEIAVVLAVLIATPIVTVKLVKRHRRKRKK